jgi:MoxR-like ATPase
VENKRDNTGASWHLFQGTGTRHNAIERLPAPPPWREFTETARNKRGQTIQVGPDEIEMVNAALYLRRPLLITGKPGTGKTSLAYAVAHELGLGTPLVWPIGTRSTLKDGLYRYDAVGRLQDSSPSNVTVKGGRQSGMGTLSDVSNSPTSDSVDSVDIGRYLRLGPLGTAMLPSEYPRVLLIDEIDKSDIDLPNELLHIFEEGEFEIPELARLPEHQSEIYVRPSDDGSPVSIHQGRVRCSAFPLVFLTSNGEREFPPAFLRRCLRLQIAPPNPEKLLQIVESRFELDAAQQRKIKELVEAFVQDRDYGQRDLATDQLLNAVYLTLHQIDPLQRDRQLLRDTIWKSLSDSVSLA